MKSEGAMNTLVRKMGNFEEFNYLMNVKNVLIAQGYAQLCSHMDIVNRYKVTLFIELGIYMGGVLTHLIPNLVLDNEFHYLGFEIVPSAVKPQIINFAISNPRCQIVLEDMFTKSNLYLIENKIKEAKGRVYIFCDGGNKPKELLTFSQLMRVGDIISVHDYTEDQTGEIRDADLAKLSDDFEPLDEHWRKDMLWMPTFIKTK